MTWKKISLDVIEKTDKVKETKTKEELEKRKVSLQKDLSNVQVSIDEVDSMLNLFIE